MISLPRSTPTSTAQYNAFASAKRPVRAPQLTDTVTSAVNILSEENTMLRKLMIAALACAAMSITTTAFAQGTAAEAKTMLDKAVTAVKADKAKAIKSFLEGTDGFKDRDLYPFCFNTSDGITQAAPASVLGKDVRTLKDATGNAFGADIYKAAQEEGKINEVSYMFPKPGATEPSPKTSFVTKVGDLGCGVGYYK
jgi:signal transduction histidine kinase